MKYLLIALVLCAGCREKSKLYLEGFAEGIRQAGYKVTVTVTASDSHPVTITDSTITAGHVKLIGDKIFILDRHTFMVANDTAHPTLSHQTSITSPNNDASTQPASF